jgi:queuosine precursor transporter
LDCVVSAQRSLAPTKIAVIGFLKPDYRGKAMSDTNSEGAMIPRSLFMFSIIYGGMVCIAGVLGNKQVSLGPLAVEAGIFPFLLLVILSSAVAALHGKEIADRLVKYGFIPLIGSILLTALVYAIPASPKMDPKYLDAFNTMMGQTPRIWLAGIVAYGTSQMLNVYLFDRLKNSVGKYVAVRGAIAAVLSQIVDTLLFVAIAFYGVFPITDLLLGQMLAKVVLSMVLVPLLITFFVQYGHKLDGTKAS